MARPRVPISRTDYYVRGHSGLVAWGTSEDYRPLSSFKAQDDIASSLGHLWLAQGQHYVNWLTPTAGTPISFDSGDTAGKSGNPNGTHLRTFSWICRLLPDARPEPVRVVLRAKKAAGGDSNFWIRAVLRYSEREPRFSWPAVGDGWSVGQALFTSSSLAETEVATVAAAAEMYGILQIHPSDGVPDRPNYQRDGGITTADDWEPIRAPALSLDLYGGFTSGTTGTPELWGCCVRAAAYGAKDPTT